MIFNQLRTFKFLILCLISANAITTLHGQCPDFEFCMSEPFYDETEHLFGIDVSLKGFGDQYAAGIWLMIEYSNTLFVIDQTKTEASLFGNLEDIKVGLHFDIDNGVIELSGTQPPYNDGPKLTTSGEQLLFTIYYSAEAGACANFTFTMTDILVSFPTSGYSICTGGIGSGCEPSDVCLVDFTLSGLIESPILNCENSHDGGINAIDIEFQESYDVDAFNGSAFTDAYGEYEHQVVGGLDYRITPVHDYNRNCGLSSLDIDILYDHLQCIDLVDNKWQLLSGDINHNGVLSTIDLTQILMAILEIDGVDWASWTFVSALDYNSMTLPSNCFSNWNLVPDFNHFIDVDNVTVSVSNQDFVGIKMGDANGTCTECSNPFSGDEKVFVRSTPAEINLIETGKNEYALSFNSDVKQLEVILLAFTCDSKPEILSSPWLGKETFVTKYKDGIFYLGYIAMQQETGIFDKNEPFMILRGDFQNSISAGNLNQNEMVVNNVVSSLMIRKSKQLYYDVAPNPNNGDFSVLIQSNDLYYKPTFTLFDAYGQRIINKSLIQPNTTFSLPLSAGIYLYQIRIGDKLRAGKLIVE
ncbi:MAG: T9SS type A sorting domain-containing protein [Saprospiraceae bacterium]